MGGAGCVADQEGAQLQRVRPRTWRDGGSRRRWGDRVWRQDPAAAEPLGAAEPGRAESAEADAAGQEPVVITYHEPCHLGRRYQDVTAQPRQILRSLKGYEFREAAESDSCCGAAGTYGVLHPETSAAIIDRKTGFIKDTGATVVATECPSCMMQLAYGLKQAGVDAEVLNISQLCDQELRTRVSK